jgi:TonB dependent receptor-like, beta-barrel/CarboxypepD_reg-like domain/TonB-dependent Receptor Plug Domain
MFFKFYYLKPKGEKHMNKLITLCLFILLLPSILLAQGSIKGTVTDLQTGEPLIGANVLVEGTTFGAATDANGVYQISNLNAGTYSIRASFIGYQTITTTDVRVNASLTTELNFKLPAEGIQVQEIQVVAQRPLVNKSNTNAIRITTNEQIDALPIRGIANIAALTPGVIQQNGNLYIRGSRQDEVGYYLEGTNITNPLNSDIYGGPAYYAAQVNVPQDAVEEIQVQAGGYTAEFGGSNAGIIRTQLKSGGPELKASLQYITDNWTFKSRANRYDGAQHLGTYSYGFNDITGTISMPIVDHIKFFGLLENTSMADRAPSFYPGFNYGPVADNVTPGDSVVLNYPGGPLQGNTRYLWSGAATVTLDYNPTIVRLLGTYSFNKDRVLSANPTRVMFDLNRLPVRDNYNGDFGLKVTQILNESAYLEVSGSYIFNKGETYDPQLGSNFWAYGDKVANAAAGVPWTYSPYQTATGRYDVPQPYVLFSTFQFYVPNQPLIGADPQYSYLQYNKFENTNIDLNAALSYELNKENSLKVGGEIQMMKIRSYTPDAGGANLAQLVANAPAGQTQADILIQNGLDNYGYTALGEVYNGASNYSTGSTAPHKPIFAGAYIQDKLEYKNLIVNAGVRYDYINTDNYAFADPQHPNLAYNATTLKVTDASQLVKVSAYSSISPRLGFSFPITDRTVFHAQYGKFVQQPSLADLYASPYLVAYFLSPSNSYFNPAPWGLNLRPTRTTQYEIGFTQQIGSFASIDITAYYKDISNQVVFASQAVDAVTGWHPYQILTNGDYATTSGFEIDYRMRRTQRFLVTGSLSLQNAKGTGDNPYANSGEFGAPIQNVIYTPNYIIPLSFNHTINGNLNIDYHFEKDDGPSVLQQFGVSLLLTFSSGHPYTLATDKSPGTSNPVTSVVYDTRNRFSLEPLNTSVTPSNFQVDMRIDKTVEFMDNLSANIFIQVINLFNTKNVVDVYSNTGSAETNGFLTNPNLNGYKQTNTYGQIYSDVYKSIALGYNGLYSAPRQIRLGLRLEY